MSYVKRVLNPFLVLPVFIISLIVIIFSSQDKSISLVPVTGITVFYILMLAIKNRKAFSSRMKKRCPECKSPLVVRVSTYGKFKGCRSFPECTYSTPLKRFRFM